MTSAAPELLEPTSARQRGEERLARLAESAAALVGRRTGGRDERWLLIVGGTALPLGLVLILLGWWGTAHTAVPFEQTPYLVSGGILGLALVIGGGLLYFAYWLTLGVREARADRERAAAHDARVEELLAELVTRFAPAPRRTTALRLVTTPAGTLVHRPDCVVAEGLDVVEQDGLAPGQQACGLCLADLPYPEDRPAARRRAPRQRATR